MQATFNGDRVQKIMTEFGQTNKGNYSADQIAKTALEWASKSAKHADIFVGWATKDRAGVETAFSQEDYEASLNGPRKTIVVWLYNNNDRAELINEGYDIGSESDDIVQNHWSGLARPWQSGELRDQITIQPPAALLQQPSSDAQPIPVSLPVAEQDASTSPPENGRQPSEFGKTTATHDSSPNSLKPKLPSKVPQQDGGLAQQLFHRAFPDGTYDFITVKKGPGGLPDAICASMAAQHPSIPKSSQPTPEQIQGLQESSSIAAECKRAFVAGDGDYPVGLSVTMKHWSLRHLPGKKVYLCALCGEHELKTYVSREQADDADAIIVWIHNDKAFATARRAGMSRADANKFRKNSYKGLTRPLGASPEAASQIVQQVLLLNQPKTIAALQTPKPSPELTNTTRVSEPPESEEVRSLRSETSNESERRVSELESNEQAFSKPESSVDEDDYEALFDEAFLTDPLIIRNQCEGVEHAIQAVIDSMSQQHKKLPTPTMEDLLSALGYESRNKAVLYEHHLFSALETWAWESHQIMDISLGIRYEAEGKGFDYVIIRSDGMQEFGHIVWVQSNNLKDKDKLWSGLKQRLIQATRGKKGQQKVASGPSGNQDAASAHGPPSSHGSSSLPQLKTPPGTKPDQNTPRNQSISYGGAESLDQVMKDTVTRQPSEDKCQTEEQRQADEQQTLAADTTTVEASDLDNDVRHVVEKIRSAWPAHEHAEEEDVKQRARKREAKAMKKQRLAEEENRRLEEKVEQRAMEQKALNEMLRQRADGRPVPEAEKQEAVADQTHQQVDEQQPKRRATQGESLFANVDWHRLAEETRPQLAAQRGVQQPEPSTNIQDPDFAFTGSGWLGAFPKPAVEEPAVQEPAVEQPESMPVQEYGRTEPQSIGQDDDDGSELTDVPSDMSDTPPFSPVVPGFESDFESEHESKNVRQKSPRTSIRQMELKKAVSGSKKYGAEKSARNKAPMKVPRSGVLSRPLDDGKDSPKSPVPSDSESEASDDPSRGLRTMNNSLAQSNRSLPWAQTNTHKQRASIVSLTHLDQPLQFDISRIPPPPPIQPFVPPLPPTQPFVVSPDYRSLISSSFQADVPMELSPEDFAEMWEQTPDADPGTLSIDPRILSNDWTGLQGSADTSLPPSAPMTQLEDLDPSTQQKVAKQLDELQNTQRQRLAGTATDILAYPQPYIMEPQTEHLQQPAPATDIGNDDIELDDLEKDVEQSQMIE